MKTALNNYYIETIECIIRWIKASTPGRRAWVSDLVTGYNDYSMTERSTFPDWIKFWYECTPKRERLEYLITDREPWEDGYFNGNTRELMIILNRAKDTGVVSKRSKRILVAFDTIVSGYLEEMEYMMEECPF